MAMNQGEVERMLRRHDNDITEIDAMLAHIQGTQGRHTRRFETIDGTLEALDTRLGRVETKVDGLDSKVDGLETKVDEILTLLRPGT